LISVGVLAGIWTQVSSQLGLITWVAFVAWAWFFAAGGGFDGFRKGLAANLSGVFCGLVVSLVIARVTFNGALAIIVTILAFILCVQAAWSRCRSSRVRFVGTAVFFGTSFAFWPTVLALVIGAGLGWLSAIIETRIQAAVDPGSAAQSPSKELGSEDLAPPVQPA